VEERKRPGMESEGSCNLRGFLPLGEIEPFSKEIVGAREEESC
jgi:hypothetical protein